MRGVVIIGGVIAGLIAGLTLTAVSALAEKSNEDEIRTLLIKKLNNVHLTLPNESPTKLALTLRIADLLSERARAEAKKELGAGCTVCVAGLEDRKRALALYNEALPKVQAENLGRVLTQIGHLYELTGNENAAIKSYKQIIAQSQDLMAIADAELSLAEMYFKKNNFSEARVFYEKVYTSTARASKGLAAYRMAWCDFRSGKVKLAIEMAQNILSRPELQARSQQSDIVTVDAQFKEEVTHDFVTFLAQNNANVNAAQLVYDLSPSDTKLNHVFDLAVELDRLGQRANSIAIWRFLQEKETRVLQRLEGFVRLAQLEMEQNNLTKGADEYSRALNLWPQACEVSQATCKELGIRIKNFAIDWYKMEQKSPSELIQAVYESYLKVFPNEVNMHLQAAMIAKQRESWASAMSNFSHAATLYKHDKDFDKLEGALLNKIEVAELSKEAKFIEEALTFYIENSVTKSAALKVRYRQAKIEYDNGGYEQAANLFRSLALRPGETAADIKEKAADLSLDALVLLKDENRLEAWAKEYAGVFSRRTKDYLAISNRATLNRAVVISRASPEKALAELNKIDRSVLTPSEQVDVCKNIIILAEKVRRFDEARRATNALLLILEIKPEDRTFALEHRVYLAELTLDFKTAFDTAKDMPQTNTDSYWLKMALLAELAGSPSDFYYEKFMSLTTDQQRSEVIAEKIIAASQNPFKEIERYKTKFKNSPEKLAALYLDIYAKKLDANIIKAVQKDLNLKDTFGRKTILRQGILSKFSNLSAAISNQHIDAGSQKKLAASIKTRVHLLSQLEQLANSAVTLEDYSSQLLTLDLLGKESKRFYEEIMSLPLPEGLTTEEQGQYLQMLSIQASPHQIRAQDLALKVNEFWQNKLALDSIRVIYPKQNNQVQALLKPEIERLAAVAPEANKSIFTEILSVKKSEEVRPVVQVKFIEVARNELRADPLNKDKIVKLLSLEKAVGKSAMVSYLESRLENLKAKDNE